MEEKAKKVIGRINEAISNLKNKKFTIYFFVIDTKGSPNGSTQYIYEMAKQLQDINYNVVILHQESKKEFVGVRNWMGNEYADLKHECIESEDVKVSTSDFLIIPEVFANVMSQVKELPCKRIILCQNVNYITEFIPIGMSWENYNISDVITTTELQANDIKSLFPNMNVNVINPGIRDFFRDDNSPKKLMVTMMVKDESIVKKIVKKFHWKFPSLRWVTFTDPRGLSKEEFADTLRESAITVWADDET